MNETGSTYTAVRIGDVSDWRLIAVISETGMTAYLKNIENPADEIVTLFEESWERDSSNLLERVENAVYDHPQVLDDFSADIALVAPAAVWVPAEYGDDEEKCCDIYSAIYSAEAQDVMFEESAGALCLYSLAPGVLPFLQRTFPGARCHSHLGVMAKRFSERGGDVPCLYVDIRDEEADFVLLDNRRLLLAATHTWKHPSDIEYKLYNILNVYGLDPREMQVSLSGLKEVRSELLTSLRRNIACVMLTMLPGIGVKSGMPLAGRLLVRS